jgi:rhamnosyltransferase
MRICCVIPTYNGKEELQRLLNSLEMQTASFDIVIVDSSSSDGTQELARKRVNNLTVILSADFNHGGTRQRMIDDNPNYDIYVFLTQDAYLADKDSIRLLISPFFDSKVGAVCGRQLPHMDATSLAQHARHFNYPVGVQIKSLSDVPKLGIKTTFMSNSFAAYRSEALRAIGGFPVHVIFAEDMYASAKMLLAGWKIAYAGNAQCYHSHNYTLFDEFERYFDIGVFHSREPWIREQFGGTGGEGFKFAKSELHFLGCRRMHLWFSAIFRNVFKLFGYKLGQQESKFPISLKRKLSMHKRYWDGPFA